MKKLESEKSREAEKHQKRKPLTKLNKNKKKKNQIHKISDHMGDIIIKRKLI